MHQVSAVPPVRPDRGMEVGDKSSALAPVPEAEEPSAKSASKTIEVNLQVSIVFFSFPFSAV